MDAFPVFGQTVRVISLTTVNILNDAVSFAYLHLTADIQIYGVINKHVYFCISHHAYLEYVLVSSGIPKHRR